MQRRKRGAMRFDLIFALVVLAILAFRANLFSALANPEDSLPLAIEHESPRATPADQPVDQGTTTDAKEEAAASTSTVESTNEQHDNSATRRADTMVLFDGNSLKNWKISEYGGHGEVEVKDGNLILGSGVDLTGVTWTGKLIRDNYEILVEAKRVDGSDFFCGLTFPVGKEPCSLIVGGWGGGLVGLSSIDGYDASENETTEFLEVKDDEWYTIRLRVAPKKIEAWIDDKQFVDVEREGREFSVRAEVELSVPLGIASWQTTAAIRKFVVRPLGDTPAENAKGE